MNVVVGGRPLTLDRHTPAVAMRGAISEVKSMPRYHVDMAIKRTLGHKIGSLRDKTLASAA